MTARFPAGTRVPVHNHGTWEAVGVHRGAVKCRLYERRDSLDRQYYADLEVIEDRVMRSGDLSLRPPPAHNVHGFTALNDDTVIIAVVGGNFAPIRQYYTPEEKFYIERHQQVWRLGGGGPK
jgi:predicted metal-dependent enzyme (double-stranded beta helix superfamily)